MKLDKYLIEKLQPTFDTEDNFMFFYNYKAASMSFHKGPWQDRIIRCKQHEYLWQQKLNHYTDEDVENMFKFSIVRNPWDRLVSAHTYFVKVVSHEVQVPKNFEIFVKKKLISLDESDLMYPHYSQKLEAHIGFQYIRASVSDIAVKMENLENEFPKILEKAQIEGIFPHKNKTLHSNYRKNYTNDLKNLVGDFYKKDIELLGYEF